MVIKAKDDIQPAIAVLEQLRSTKTLTKGQKESVEDEIDAMRAGARGEKEAAYHIDFELKESKNWAIIHDLRLEHKGRVAQIDHVLIDRFLDVFVVESKNFSTSIQINVDGEFQVKTRYGWRGMQSPVEQNRRHAEVLSSLISDAALLPKRLGFQLVPTFYKWILVAPECTVSGRNAEHDILKMDMFGARMQKFRNREATLREMAKMVASETLFDFAQKLVGHHKPILFDYAAKFGITVPQAPDPTEDTRFQPPAPLSVPSVPPLPDKVNTGSNCCEVCAKPVEDKTVTFCRLNKKRFDGKLLCRPCQESYVTSATCNECGSPVDSKVVAFCRFNSKKFGKRTLCRTCQAVAAPAA